MPFTAVMSRISAEHSQMKSSRARFKKLVQLGKAPTAVCVSALCVCHRAAVWLRGHPLLTYCLLAFVHQWVVSVTVCLHVLFFVISNFCSAYNSSCLIFIQY